MSKPKRGKTIRAKQGVASIFAAQSKERDAAIKRIASATGREPDDPDKLAASIERAHVQFELIDGAKKEHRIKTITKNLARLATDPIAREVLKKHIDFDGASASLRALEAGRWDEPIVSVGRLMVGRNPKSRPPSTFESFVSLLAMAFEERFKRKAKFSRDSAGRPKGEFVSFSEAVLAELGLGSVNRENIARGLTRLKGDRDRRRVLLVGQKT